MLEPLLYPGPRLALCAQFIPKNDLHRKGHHDVRHGDPISNQVVSRREGQLVFKPIHVLDDGLDQSSFLLWWNGSFRAEEHFDVKHEAGFGSPHVLADLGALDWVCGQKSVLRIVLFAHVAVWQGEPAVQCLGKDNGCSLGNGARLAYYDVAILYGRRLASGGWHAELFGNAAVWLTISELEIKGNVELAKDPC